LKKEALPSFPLSLVGRAAVGGHKLRHSVKTKKGLLFSRKEAKDFCFSAAPTIEAPMLQQWAGILPLAQE